MSRGRLGARKATRQEELKQKQTLRSDVMSTVEERRKEGTVHSEEGGEGA